MASDLSENNHIVTVPVQVMVDLVAYKREYGDVSDVDEYTAEQVRAVVAQQLHRLGWACLA